MAQRSTKGASKQRRDAINALIAQIRELLPVPEAVRARLSQLQVMALSNAYIAISNFFASRYGLEAASRSTIWSQLFDISPTLPGFLLVASVDGRILYVSDSVSEYLGNSAVDIMTQMESVYELFDDHDREILHQAMQQQPVRPASSSPAAAAANPWMRDIQVRELQQQQQQLGEGLARRLSFTCRMNVAARGIRSNSAAVQSSAKFGFDRQKIMQVTGRILQQKSSDYCSPLSCNNDQQSAVLVAYCTPHLGVFNGSSAMSGFASVDNIEGNTNAFYSLHHADMKFANIEPNGEYHIGYNKDTIYGKSWYEKIHPADVDEARCRHMELMGDYQIGDLSSVKSVCVRIQSCHGDFIWLHVVMRIHDNSGTSDTLPPTFNTTGIQPLIVCTNHAINEEMAMYIRAREQEAQLATRNDSSQNFYPLSVGSSNIQMCDTMSLPDFKVSKRTSSLANEVVTRYVPGRSQKRRYNDCESTGVVISQKIPKVIEEDSFDRNSSVPNMVLSMPSPPLPHCRDVDAFERANQMPPGTRFSPNPTAFFGGFSMQGFNNRAVMADGFPASPTGSSVASNASPIQIPDAYLTPKNSPNFAMQENSQVEGYMSVPDMRVNHPELDNLREFSTLYCSDPQSGYGKSASTSVLRSGLGDQYHSTSGFGVSLPELDQSLIESVLEPLECVPGPCFPCPSPVSASCGYATAASQPTKMPPAFTSVGNPQLHQQQLTCLGDEDNTNLIHELLTLGQEFLESEPCNMYYTNNPLYFV